MPIRDRAASQLTQEVIAGCSSADQKAFERSTSALMDFVTRAVLAHCSRAGVWKADLQTDIAHEVWSDAFIHVRVRPTEDPERLQRRVYRLVERALRRSPGHPPSRRVDSLEETPATLYMPDHVIGPGTLIEDAELCERVFGVWGLALARLENSSLDDASFWIDRWLLRVPDPSIDYSRNWRRVRALRGAIHEVVVDLLRGTFRRGSEVHRLYTRLEALSRPPMRGDKGFVRFVRSLFAFLDARRSRPG